MFSLHSNLASKIFVIDLPLSKVLLEDNKHYPWLFLVPRKANVHRLIDLAEGEEKELWRELRYAQQILLEEFKVDHVNVAAIGNKTSQLHIHVIGRCKDDPAWPNCVWDHAAASPYSTTEKKAVLDKLCYLFTKYETLPVEKSF